MIPYIGSLFCFDISTHKKASTKALLLWLLVTSPILFAICFSEVSEKDRSGFSVLSTQFAEAIISKVHEFLKRDGIYVYTVSFVAPFLFLIVGRHQEPSTSSTSKNLRAYRRMFRGYWLCFWTSIALLIVTALSFSATVVAGSAFENTILYFITAPNTLWFYGIAVFFWYLSLLDESNTGSGYVESVRSTEADLVNRFSERISEND